ncbi:hypothetical protein D3C87_295640 [compost metagenome]
MVIRRLIYLIVILLQAGLAIAQTLDRPYIVPRGTPVNLNVGNSNGNYTYEWYRNGIAIPNANQASYTVTQEGNYTVRIVSESEAGCPSELSDIFSVVYERYDLEIVKKSETRAVGPNEPFQYTITVSNKGNMDVPNVVMTDPLPANLMYLGIERVSSGQANNQNGVITWTIPLVSMANSETLLLKVQARMPGNVVNTARVDGEPNLNEVDLTNNTSTDTKKIAGDIKVPNVITPNGDGKNDVLKIEGIELYRQNSLAIFNRWGNEVYRSPSGYQNNWNGEGLSEGTYYYVLKLVSKEGISSSRTGYITLLRDK